MDSFGGVLSHTFFCQLSSNFPGMHLWIFFLQHLVKNLKMSTHNLKLSGTFIQVCHYVSAAAGPQVTDALSCYFQVAAKKSTFRFYLSQNNHKVHSSLDYNINWDCRGRDQERVCIICTSRHASYSASQLAHNNVVRHCCIIPSFHACLPIAFAACCLQHYLTSQTISL